MYLRNIFLLLDWFVCFLKLEPLGLTPESINLIRRALNVFYNWQRKRYQRSYFLWSIMSVPKDKEVLMPGIVFKILKHEPAHRATIGISNRLKPATDLKKPNPLNSYLRNSINGYTSMWQFICFNNIAHRFNDCWSQSQVRSRCQELWYPEVSILGI